METILYSQIIRRKVDTPTKEGKAKLVDVLASWSTGYWEASEIIVETGLISSKGKFFSSNELTNLTAEGALELSKTMKEGNSAPKEENEIYLNRLDGTKVETYDGNEVGRIYDYEIYTDSHPWKIWKLLVNPTGLSPLKRRIRIPTKNVKEIGKKKVVLKEGYKGV